MVFKKAGNLSPGGAAAVVPDNHIRSEGLWGENEQRPIVRCPFCQFFLNHAQQQVILLLLAHCLEFVIRIDIGLYHHDIQAVVAVHAVIILPSDYWRHCKRQDESHCKRGKGCSLCLPIETVPSAVGQHTHEPEDSEVAGPYPERSPEQTGELVPLHGPCAACEGIAQHQPRPRDLSVKVKPLPGNPCRCKKDVGQSPPEILLALAEQAENQRHLKGICKNCEQPSSDSGIAYPECRECIPKDEGTVVIDPDSAYPCARCYPFHAQKRNQTKQSQDSRVRYYEWDGHQHCKKQYQGPKYHLFLFHFFWKIYSHDKLLARASKIHANI